MCLFHRRHTETSTEDVQAGGVMVVFIAKVVKHDHRHPAGEPTGAGKTTNNTCSCYRLLLFI